MVGFLWITGAIFFYWFLFHAPMDYSKKEKTDYPDIIKRMFR